MAGAAHSGTFWALARSPGRRPTAEPNQLIGVAVVEFDSYEQAMKNSNDPVTGEYAQQMGALLDGPPRFYNLDVRMVQTLRS